MQTSKQINENQNGNPNHKSVIREAAIRVLTDENKK
jgi:hypothetical protein